MCKIFYINGSIRRSLISDNVIIFVSKPTPSKTPTHTHTPQTKKKKKKKKKPDEQTNKKKIQKYTAQLLWEYDNESHSKSPHWKALQKVITLKISV